METLWTGAVAAHKHQGALGTGLALQPISSLSIQSLYALRAFHVWYFEKHSSVMRLPLLGVAGP